MKRVIIQSLLALSILGVSTGAFAEDLKCRQGLSWTISQNPNWGFGRPVVTKVLPYSVAAEAGLKSGDIIERIDGFDTSSLSSEQVKALLHNEVSLHTIQTSNIGAEHKKHIIGLQCRSIYGFDERELAELFSLYSVEDAHLEHIVYPYTYTSSEAFSPIHLRTYMLAHTNIGQNSELDEANTIFSKVLESKGLQASVTADVLASMEYSLQPLNLTSTEQSGGFSWRYDYPSKELRPFPVYARGQRGVESAKYLLTFILRLRDAETKEVLWSCEAKEYLSEEMSLSEYAESAIPSMFENFPFTMNGEAPSVAVRTLRYNYTGIIYDKSKINEILDVEEASPAMMAGLRTGDIILSINGLPLNKPSIDNLLESYFKTAERLERHRDSELPVLMSLLGNLPVSYWKLDRYDAVASILAQNKSDAAFAYLFAFRPYVLGESSKPIIYEIQRNKEVYYVPIAPQYRDETVVYPILNN